MGLTHFEAQARRPWYSYNQLLRTAVQPGKPWLLATITLNSHKVRVSTSEETLEFKPLRIAWREIDQVAISGLDPKGRLRRSLLRFDSQERAEQTALAIKGLGRIEEEPLFWPDEIPLKARYEIPKLLKLVILPLLLFPLTAIIFVVFAAPYPLLVIWVIALFFFQWPYLFLVRRLTTPRTKENQIEGRLTHPFEAWLGQRAGALSLRTRYGTAELTPRVLSWKNSTTLILTAEHTRVQLEFSTPDDATRAFPNHDGIPATNITTGGNTILTGTSRTMLRLRRLAVR